MRKKIARKYKKSKKHTFLLGNYPTAFGFFSGYNRAYKNITTLREAIYESDYLPTILLSTEGAVVP